MQQPHEDGTHTIAVVICTYGAADVITDCLDSLAATTGVRLRVAICDNASPDATVAVVTDWAAKRGIDVTHAHAGDQAGADPAWLSIVQSPSNLGFAGGVNAGLTWFLPCPEIDLFWVLNPDSMVRPDTAAAYAARAGKVGTFGLMGGRTQFAESPGLIQSDGGRVRHWTGGVCLNVNNGMMPETAVPPEANSLDFLSGANLVASRAFLETVGLMKEDYFLYYEEVDWAYRRGDLPLITCPDAVVHHHGGTAIGSSVMGRPASAFANYFIYRNRMRFVARFAWGKLPVAYAVSLAQIAKMIRRGGWSAAASALRGLHGMAPSDAVANRVSPDARARAFGR